MVLTVTTGSVYIAILLYCHLCACWIAFASLSLVFSISNGIVKYVLKRMRIKKKQWNCLNSVENLSS